MPDLATIDDVVSCLELQHECQADQVIENEMPRFRELLGLAGAALP